MLGIRPGQHQRLSEVPREKETAGQRCLIDQVRDEAYERISGLKAGYHRHALELLGEAMLTGDTNLEQIRPGIGARGLAPGDWRPGIGVMDRRKS